MNKLIAAIRKDRNYTFTTLSTLCVIFLWFLIKVVYPSVPTDFLNIWRIIAGLFFGLYWLIGAAWLGLIFQKITKLNSIWSLLFGIFLLLYLLSFVSAFWIVFYRITVELVTISLIFLILAISFFRRRLFSANGNFELVNNRDSLVNNRDSMERKKAEMPIFIFGSWIWPVLIILAAISLGLLFLARTGKYIVTPWDVIGPAYLYIYLVISFFVVLLIFSQHKIKLILLIIILHSFLLHSYLPIVYEQGFEGDKWRHLGAERWLQAGRVYSPSLFGEENLSVKKVGPVPVPEVFIVGNKTSYANQWGLTIFLSWLFKSDVFWIDLLLIFILWSIFVPLFLFKVASFFIPNQRGALLFAFIPAIFYPLQVYGSVTLPVAFGFLYFVFILILWLLYLDDNEGGNQFLRIILVLSGFMYLNYLVYLVLILEIGVFIVIFKKLILPRLLIGKGPPVKIMTAIFLIFAFEVAFIPILDQIIGISSFKFEDLTNLWQLPARFGEFFLGKLLALSDFIPLPTFISQGNFIFMQFSRSFLSEATLLTFISWQKYLSILIWFLIIYGIVRLGKAKSLRVSILWLIILMIILLNRFISMYYMDGIRLIAKRLDLLVAFFMIAFISFGSYHAIFEGFKFFDIKVKLVALALFLGVTSCATYASGPKLEVVTSDEMKAAEYVWNDIENQNNLVDDKNYCVLANTWPLLALESVSSRQLVAGGFPVYTDYAQPERVQLWKKMMEEPSIRYLKKSADIAGSHWCYLMIEKKWLDVQEKNQEAKLKVLKEMLDGYKQFGDVYVFYYERN